MGRGMVLEYAPRDNVRRWQWGVWQYGLFFGLLSGIAGVVVPRFQQRGGPSRHSLTRQDLARLQLVLEAFRQDNGRYPTAEEGLAALSQRPAGLEGWRGPYVARPSFLDPWGNPYEYAPAADESRLPVVTSAGPDGVAGTEDDVGKAKDEG